MSSTQTIKKWHYIVDLTNADSLMTRNHSEVALEHQHRTREQPIQNRQVYNGHCTSYNKEMVNSALLLSVLIRWTHFSMRADLEGFHSSGLWAPLCEQQFILGLSYTLYGQGGVCLSLCARVGSAAMDCLLPPVLPTGGPLHNKTVKSTGVVWCRPHVTDACQ